MSKQPKPVRDVVGVVNATLGLLGAALALFFGWAFCQGVSGPGDDNPILMVFPFAAGLALLPAWGLVRFLRGKRLSGSGVLWLAGASAAAFLLLPFARVFVG